MVIPALSMLRDSMEAATVDAVASEASAVEGGEASDFGPGEGATVALGGPVLGAATGFPPGLGGDILASEDTFGEAPDYETGGFFGGPLSWGNISLGEWIKVGAYVLVAAVAVTAVVLSAPVSVPLALTLAAGATIVAATSLWEAALPEGAGLPWYGGALQVVGHGMVAVGGFGIASSLLAPAGSAQILSTTGLAARIPGFARIATAINGTRFAPLFSRTFSAWLARAAIMKETFTAAGYAQRSLAIAGALVGSGSVWELAKTGYSNLRDALFGEEARLVEGSWTKLGKVGAAIAAKSAHGALDPDLSSGDITIGPVVLSSGYPGAVTEYIEPEGPQAYAMSVRAAQLRSIHGYTSEDPKATWAAGEGHLLANVYDGALLDTQNIDSIEGNMYVELEGVDGSLEVNYAGDADGMRAEVRMIENGTVREYVIEGIEFGANMDDVVRRELGISDLDYNATWNETITAGSDTLEIDYGAERENGATETWFDGTITTNAGESEFYGDASADAPNSFQVHTDPVARAAEARADYFEVPRHDSPAYGGGIPQ